VLVVRLWVVPVGLLLVARLRVQLLRVVRLLAAPLLVGELLGVVSLFRRVVPLWVAVRERCLVR
jgi:hypothetical protein